MDLFFYFFFLSEKCAYKRLLDQCICFRKTGRIRRTNHGWANPTDSRDSSPIKLNGSIELSV